MLFVMSRQSPRATTPGLLDAASAIVSFTSGNRAMRMSPSMADLRICDPCARDLPVLVASSSTSGA